ncbi:MAG: GNAT family N-acetyltransferase [Rhodobacteraceae bacterium]|nr:GNAT family N-acetyltransferase [Paracoccaceae bacterium]
MTGFMSLDREGYLDMAFVLPEVMGKGVARALWCFWPRRVPAA